MELDKPGRVIKSRKGKRGPDPFLGPQDRLIVEYIWRWKIASTASVHEALFQMKTPYSTYKRLDHLAQSGFIESRHNDWERFYVWQLTERGFNTIKEYLGELKEEGYLSENHRHDRLVQAFQLGEWSTHQFPRVIFFTEQEMRRREPDNYPSWVPQSNDHRPDGYTRLVGEKKARTIAFEVELSTKNVQKYEGILRFYRSVRLVDRVIWLVESDVVRDTILRAKTCIKDDSSNYHLFVTLRDFERNGWDASVANERSQTLFTLREKYRGIFGDTLGEILGKLKGQSRVTVHLTGQKVIGKSRS